MRRYPKYLMAAVVVSLFAGIANTACTSSISDSSIIEDLSKVNEVSLDVAETNICKGYSLGVPPIRYSRGRLSHAWVEICSARAARIKALKEKEGN